MHSLTSRIYRAINIMAKPNGEELLIIKPHQYPIWIYAFILGFLALLYTAFSLLSPYNEASKKIRLAEEAYAESDYLSSAEKYLDALDLAPLSKKAKKGLALSVFANPNLSKEDKILGLDALEGISLRGKEWDEISKKMPEEFLEYFETAKW
jgi:hypothetical protein